MGVWINILIWDDQYNKRTYNVTKEKKRAKHEKLTNKGVVAEVHNSLKSLAYFENLLISLRHLLPLNQKPLVLKDHQMPKSTNQT